VLSPSPRNKQNVCLRSAALFFSFRDTILSQQSNLDMISRLKRKMSRTWQVLRRKGNRGYCSICERQVYFEIEGPWLRDQYKCISCQSIPRWRALMLVVAELYPKWRQLKIHESSPGGPLSAKLARECPKYLPSHFFPDTPRGQIHRGFRCEERCSFSSTQEVFWRRNQRAKLLPSRMVHEQTTPSAIPSLSLYNAFMGQFCAPSPRCDGIYRIVTSSFSTMGQQYANKAQKLHQHSIDLVYKRLERMGRRQ
jgi:hypothetical protein